MSKEFTAKEAAEELGVSDSRIRQLALAQEIEHRYFGKMLVITERGMEQARVRNSQRGRPPGSSSAQSRKGEKKAA